MTKKKLDRKALEQTSGGVSPYKSGEDVGFSEYGKTVHEIIQKNNHLVPGMNHNEQEEFIMGEIHEGNVLNDKPLITAALIENSQINNPK